VISGYLITSLIIKDLEAGKFTTLNLLELRARRILPASVVVVFATLLAGWVLLPPFDYSSLAVSAVAQALFSANIFFWKSTNYFT
jgi:peptidoglycan/LPS O-acetylase OafA/YrhL